MNPFKNFDTAKQKLTVAIQASDDEIGIFLLIDFALILN
jgi:hypothetical protein